MFNCDILDLEYSSRGRDIDIVEPVLTYLSEKKGLKVHREWVFGNVPYYLLKYRPKLVILANGVGSSEHFRAVKLASMLGIKVVTLISEGDYAEYKSGVEEFFWGWNVDKFLYEDLHFEWSQRCVDLIEKFIPESKSANIVLGGATGFDKYHFFDFKKKDEFLTKYSKKFDKIVGMAGWGFDLLLSTYFDENRDMIERRYSVDDIDAIRSSKEPLRLIYKEMIENNPDILFVLKHHPLILDKTFSEFHDLENYENVVVIVTEEAIYDVINLVDIWVAFESTTCLESWILGKQSFLINPISTTFKRSRIAQGSPIKVSYNEAQEALDSFYLKGDVPGFKELKEKRNEIVKKIINKADGFNHIHTAENIYDLFVTKRKKKIKISGKYIQQQISFMVFYFCKIVVYRTPFKFLKNQWKEGSETYLDRVQNLFNKKERLLNAKKYKESLRSFYMEKNI